MDMTDPPADSGAVLAALLERSGIEYRREGERFRFLFARGGCRWQTVCDCREGLVLIYGIYPTAIADTDAALAICNSINRQAIHGSFFVQENHLIFRTGADLLRLCDAAETTARALEYNAAAVYGFWRQLAEAAGDATPISREGTL